MQSNSLTILKNATDLFYELLTNKTQCISSNKTQCISLATHC